MASLYPGHVGAVQVGAYFLEQYYRILQQQPELVHQFYTEMSSMVRFDGTATETASGMVQIHRLVMCLNFKGIEIKSAHSLESWNGGVLVMVSGYVQLEDYSVRREFVQTFFLAPQEKGFFVLNDIFHFLEEEHTHQRSEAFLSQNDFETKLNVSNSVPEPASDYILGEEIQARDLEPVVAPSVHVETNDIVEKYSSPEAPQQLPYSDDRLDEPVAEDITSFPRALESTKEPPPPAPEELIVEPAKQTYASILRAKTQYGPPMHHGASSTKTTQVASEWTQSAQPAYQSQAALVPEKSNANAEAIEEPPLVEDEGDARSVYVGNLPPSISTADLEQVFKYFGRLRLDGVSIRSRKESDVFYAFIEYEDVIGVQNALKASPVQLNGRLIHVEGRRPNSGVSRGKKGRGRGGHTTEVPRGRFSGRLVGRGSRQDNTDRDYTSSRSRGNGYPQRVQERGY